MDSKIRSEQSELKRNRPGQERHWSRWLVRAQLALLAIIICAGAALRLELAHFGVVFKVFRYAGLTALAVALLGMLVFMWGLWKRNADARRAALWAAVLGVIPVAVPLLTVGKSNFNVPGIHDISTDMQKPPQFKAVLSLRDSADNSAEYDPKVAEVQRDTVIYQDIQPLQLPLPPAEVFELAVRTAEGLGWRVVAKEPQRGHLEAVDRTLLLGFSDDVVVRVQAQGEGTQVDVRSASRVGQSDLGANAKRIREFLTRLRASAGQPE